MDAALLVALWLACSLAVVGVQMARGRSKGHDPEWLVPASVLLGPVGLVVLVGWTVSHRPRPQGH